jgi:hypothetical protein
MRKIKLLLFAVSLTAISTFLQAQNSTQSPYTYYGYGKLADQTFASQRGMGGIGIGLRNSQIINPLNPAALSSIDSMTFMLDVGVMGQMARFEEGELHSKKINGNLEYLAFQFPLAKKLGMSVGFKPISYVGYRFGHEDSLQHLSGTSQSIYTGKGGLNKIYGTISYLLHPRLAVGLNAGYLFGNIIHNGQSLPVTGSTHFSFFDIDTIHSSQIVYEFGVQYIHPLGKNRSVVLGAVFLPKMNINARLNRAVIRVDPSSSAVQSDPEYSSTKDLKFELPETYGLGFTFNEQNKWTAGMDIQYLRWASARFYNQTDTLSNQLKINLGGEYTPDYRSNNFFKRIRYRAGLNYANSYIKVAGKGYNEYGASLGLGIPMNDRRSFLNLAFDYTTLRPETQSLSANKNYTFINEQYFKITVSYTFNELWFFKRKVQ